MTDKKQVNNLTIQINVEITDEDIDDIMCAALEGGVNYWCREAEVLDEYLGEYGHEQIARGGRLKFWLIEPFNDRNTWAYTLDKTKLLKGIRQYLEDPEKPYNILEPKYEKDKYGNIQYALFGEIVFA